jgi:hypothetical protein
MDSYVEFPPLLLKSTAPRTIELWLTLDKQPEKNPRMPLVLDWDFLKLTFNGAGDRWMVYTRAEQTGARHFESDLAPATGRPTHVAIVWTGEELQFYVDGRLQSQHDYFSSKSDEQGNLRLGKATPTSTLPSFEGVVHSLRISSVRRYRGHFTPATAFESDDHTLGLYRFDEGVGDVLKDASSNRRDGKIVEATWVKPSAERRTTALQFDGDGDEVKLPAVNLPGRAITLEAWATLGTDNLGKHGIPLWQWGETSVSVKADGSPVIDLAKTDGGFGGVTYLRPRDKVVQGKRTHFAAVITDERCELFVNGHKAGSQPAHVVMGDVEAFWTKLQAAECTLGSRKLSLEGQRSYWTGTISAFRISGGVRYVDKFTPPPEFEADDNTLAVYRFDGASPEMLRDACGNELHAAITGAKWTTEAKPDSASVAPPPGLEFDGVDDMLSIPTLVYDGSHPVTIEGWLTLPEYQIASPATIFALAGRAADGQRFQVPVYFVHGDEGSGKPPRIHVGKAMEDRIEYRKFPAEGLAKRTLHVAAVVENGQYRLFLDGQPMTGEPGAVEYASDGGVPEPLSLAGAVQLLERDGIDGWFHGVLHSLRVSSNARYQDAFTAPARLEADEHTMALYDFAGVQDGVVKDASGNARDGTITGARPTAIEMEQSPKAPTDVPAAPGDEATGS